MSRSDNLILSALIDAGPLSRSQLAIATGLTKPAVGALVSELQARGIVEEGEPIRGARGQPSRPVSLKREAIHAIGIYFSHTYLEAAVVDVLGAPIGSVRVAIGEPTPENIVEASREAISTLRKKHRKTSSALVGIGFAVPADFHPDGESLRAHIYFPALEGWAPQEALQAHFDVPVFVENDGRSCAIGERLAGLGRQRQDFLLVHVGHGVGGGVFINGKLHRGAHQNAGPLGQFFPLDQPRPSGQDLLEGLREAGYPIADFDGFGEIVSEATSFLDRWIDRAGGQLARAVHGVVGAIDPELVIIGGRLPSSILRGLATRIEPAISGGELKPPLASCPVLGSSLGPLAGAIGAASLPILDTLGLR